MKKVYCQNCGKEVPSNHIKELELFSKETYVCSCGFYPNQSKDRDTMDVENYRYQIQYCECCGISFKDGDFESLHFDFVNEETGEVQKYCKVSKRGPYFWYRGPYF